MTGRVKRLAVRLPADLTQNLQQQAAQHCWSVNTEMIMRLKDSFDESSAREAPDTIMSVPQAGRTYFNLGRNSSYRLAARGDIPTFRIGKLLRVSSRAMDQVLRARSLIGGAVQSLQS